MTLLPSENETYLVSPARGGDVEAVRPRQRGHENKEGSQNTKPPLFHMEHFHGGGCGGGKVAVDKPAGGVVCWGCKCERTHEGVAGAGGGEPAARQVNILARWSRAWLAEGA